ncbi:MAG TPA: transglycosylase SLT domain-containing protein [Microvirga sp.]|nr:transglycosylase SLT domain-containing protein [Microvirga sp.]
MTTKTMAHGASARTPHEVAKATKSGFAPASVRRGILYGAVLVGVASLQLISAGPAAVATVPTQVRIREAEAALVTPPHHLAIVPRDPRVVASILDDAFPPLRPAAEVAAILDEAFPRKPAAAGDAPGAERSLNPDEVMSFGGKQAPRWLVDTILKAAERTGVDPVYLMTLADVESSLEPQAKAPTSSAEGLFQFIDQTWLEVLHQHAAAHGFPGLAEAVRMTGDEVVLADESKRAWVFGLKRDPYLAAVMAGELIKDIHRALQSEGERELAEAELYLAHFFGAKAAVRFLKALDEEPNAVAARLFPKAAKANLGRSRRRRDASAAPSPSPSSTSASTARSCAASTATT